MSESMEWLRVLQMTCLKYTQVRLPAPKQTEEVMDAMEGANWLVSSWGLPSKSFRGLTKFDLVQLVADKHEGAIVELLALMAANYPSQVLIHSDADVALDKSDDSLRGHVTVALAAQPSSPSPAAEDSV